MKLITSNITIQAISYWFKIMNLIIIIINVISNTAGSTFDCFSFTLLSDHISYQQLLYVATYVHLKFYFKIPSFIPICITLKL